MHIERAAPRPTGRSRPDMEHRDGAHRDPMSVIAADAPWSHQEGEVVAKRAEFVNRHDRRDIDCGSPRRRTADSCRKVDPMRCYQGRYLSIALLAPLLAAAGCVDMPGDEPTTDEAVEAVTTSEGFETGTKTAYAAADVTLGSGTWNLSDALIGTLSSDVKTGSQSGRIRNSGRITMRFDRTTGAGTVTLHHASFGTDASGTFGLFSSQNGGSTWTQVGTSRST